MCLKLPKDSLFNEALILELLSFELPDPERCLYPQPRGLFFTLFQKLPIELRLRIWQISLTFPKPRMVDIVPSMAYGRPKPPKRRKSGRKSARSARFKKLPVALWVNMESRTEALTRYCVLTHQPLRLRTHGLLLKPLYFNLTHDTLCLNSPEISRHVCRCQECLLIWKLEDHLPLLKERASKHLASIHQLLIRFFLSYTEKDYQMLFGFESAQGHDLEAHQSFWKDCLFYFPSLQNITLLFHSSTVDNKSILVPMKKFLEANKEKFVSGKAPEVVMYEDHA